MIAIFPLALAGEANEEEGAGEAQGDEGGAKKARPRLVLAAHGVPEEALVFREPRWPSRRWNIEVVSNAEGPILLPGGSLIVGGRLDRMVPEDLLLPPDETVEIETLPAEYRRDARDHDEEARRLRLSRFLAPPYLRKHAVFDRDQDLVSVFVSHFLGFRAQGDRRHSLRAVCASPVLEKEIRDDLVFHAGTTGLRSGRVVGWIAVVAGRVHGAELFGSSALARRYFLLHLRAYAFAAAALKIRAEEMGLDWPGPDDDASAERFRPEVDAFFAMLRDSRRRCGRKPTGTLGTSCLLRRDRVWGEALAREGRLVRAGAVADLPFHEQLYRRPLPPPPGEVDGPSRGPLERGSDRPGGRLTEFERRLLDRMRERRGG
jgi:hypothetical protein